MAWPLSGRYQDFTDNTVPAITAAFLHAVQDAIGKIYSGTQTLKALVVDGTGGVAATPQPGDISASRSLRAARTVSGTTAPTNTVDAGELPLSLVPVGWARLDSLRGLIRGVNVYAVDSGLGNGIYQVTFDRVLAAIGASAPIATLYGTSLHLHVSCSVDNLGAGGRVRVTATVYDSGGVATNPGGLIIVLFGE